MENNSFFDIFKIEFFRAVIVKILIRWYLQLKLRHFFSLFFLNKYCHFIRIQQLKVIKCDNINQKFWEKLLLLFKKLCQLFFYFSMGFNFWHIILFFLQFQRDWSFDIFIWKVTAIFLQLFLPKKQFFNKNCCINNLFCNRLLKNIKRLISFEW